MQLQTSFIERLRSALAAVLPAVLPPATSPSVGGSPHLVMVVPSDEEERQVVAMEQWFAACTSDQPFALELVGTRRAQGFVVRASSEEQLVLLCKQFAATYPQAEMQRIAAPADPLLLQAGEHAVIGEFALTQPPWMPLRTLHGKELTEPGADPLAALLAAMEPLGPGQRIIAQCALVHAPEYWMARHLRKAVEHPLQHERDAQAQATRAVPTTTTASESFKTLLLVGGLLGALLVYHFSGWYSTHPRLALVLLGLGCVAGGGGLLWWWLKRPSHVIYDMRLVAEKLSRAAFYTSVRVIIIGQQATSSEQQLRAHLGRMEVAYRQFTLASANSLSLKRTRTLLSISKKAAWLPDLAHAFAYRHALVRLLHGGAYGPDIWSSSELLVGFHLPQASTDVPLVRRVSVKHLLASPDIAREIERAPAPLPPALLGTSRHRGYAVPVYLPYTTLFAHTALFARSRYGKSTIMQLMTIAAMYPTCDGTPQPGLFVIDPHRDLIEDLLRSLPAGRAEDVVLFDFTDSEHVIALNPLDASMGFTRDQAIANLMSSFERIWADFWGPRMAYFLKSVCLLLYTLNEGKVQAGHANAQYTLLDINPLLQYPEYATQVLAQLDMSEVWHQELFTWWQQVYFALPKNSSFRSEVIMPIISKLGLFQDHQRLRRIVGQPVTKAPVHLAITSGKIILCALSARDLDDAAVNVLGSTLINLLHRAFSLQQAVAPAERRKVLCAVDEFHTFSGGDFDRLLSEDAKFGCALLLATQNIKRLNKIRDGLLEMVFANCENLCVFNVSAADAKVLAEELRGLVEQKHILSQPRLHCYARLAIAPYPLQVVSVSLASPPGWQQTTAQSEQAEAIRQRNQQYTTPAAEVDRHHAEHLAQFLDVQSYAKTLQREAKAFQTVKQQREDALRRAQEVQHEQHQQGEQTPASSSDAQPEKKTSGKPASLHVQHEGRSRQGETDDETDHDHEYTAKQQHNQQRSKRKKQSKQAIGASPVAEDTQAEQVSSEPRPGLFTGGSRKDASWHGERERER